MSRIKPWRVKSTFVFDELLNACKNRTFYLVHEPGPTNLVIQDEGKCKFKVQIGIHNYIIYIGTIVSWSWGGGQKEHWIHTIFALHRIFKIPEGEPLLWQLSYSDQEITKIIQNRERSIFRRMTEESKTRPGFLKKKGQEKPDRKTVKRLPLDGEEPWWIWFEQMTNDQNLTYWKYGWGQNIHMTWAKHLVKHKKSESKPILCPLCRANWGENALEELQKECKIFRAQQLADENNKLKQEIWKKMPRCTNWNEFVNHWFDGPCNFGGARAIRIFSWSICK